MGIFEASRGMWITFDVFGVVDKVFHNCGLFRSPSGLRSDLFPGRWNRPEDGTVRIRLQKRTAVCFFGGQRGRGASPLCGAYAFGLHLQKVPRGVSGRQTIVR